jgi:hypothetical protein
MEWAAWDGRRFKQIMCFVAGCDQKLLARLFRDAAEISMQISSGWA